MLNVLKFLQVDLPQPYQSHMLRRGCASCLEVLKFDVRLLKMHLGWSEESNQLKVYRRPVQVIKFDKLFYHDVV